MYNSNIKSYLSQRNKACDCLVPWKSLNLSLSISHLMATATLARHSLAHFMDLESIKYSIAAQPVSRRQSLHLFYHVSHPVHYHFFTAKAWFVVLDGIIMPLSCLQAYFKIESRNVVTLCIIFDCTEMLSSQAMFSGCIHEWLPRKPQRQSPYWQHRDSYISSSYIPFFGYGHPQFGDFWNESQSSSFHFRNLTSPGILNSFLLYTNSASA